MCPEFFDYHTGSTQQSPKQMLWFWEGGVVNLITPPTPCPHMCSVPVRRFAPSGGKFI